MTDIAKQKRDLAYLQHNMEWQAKCSELIKQDMELSKKNYEQAILNAEKRQAKKGKLKLNELLACSLLICVVLCVYVLVRVIV